MQVLLISIVQWIHRFGITLLHAFRDHRSAGEKHNCHYQNFNLISYHRAVSNRSKNTHLERKTYLSPGLQSPTRSLSPSLSLSAFLLRLPNSAAEVDRIPLPLMAETQSDKPQTLAEVYL